MKNLRLLNSLIFQLLLIIYSFQLKATEPVDIWENNSEVNIETIISEPTNSTDEENSLFKKPQTVQNDIFQDNNEDLDFNKVYGLFDPEENDLSLEMWMESDGNILLEHLKRIEKINLSKDSEDLLIKVLFTNAYLPIKNVNSSDFLDFKLEWLIKKNKKKIIEEFLFKNPDLENNENLLKFLIIEYLSDADIKNACDKVNYFNKYTIDNFLYKFRVYCFINNKNIEEAQLQYDLLKEDGFIDKFYNKKINYLLGYTQDIDEKVSDKNLLNFHLSYIANKDFKYEPSIQTSKYIWKYLSANNLILNENLIDLENEIEFNMYEKAASNNSYSKKKLFNIYGKFLFNFEQFLNLEESHKNLPSYKARALIYQGALLSDNLEKKFNLLSLLNDLFKKDDIENAFSEELNLILSTIDKNDVPLNFINFYQSKSSKVEEVNKKIKFDNKVLHKSKLIKYFLEDEYKNEKVEYDLNTIYKKIKKNKKYFFSIKDVILLDSLKADGINLPKKLNNKYFNDQLTIPKELIELSDEGQVGLVLLKIIEIIGEDQLEHLDADTLYFIVATLNKLDLKKIRNNIIIKTLPSRI